ncbi:MFS transporter [Corynebacterium gerontici]|uniref:Major Facilitator Superfamily protein n=1 Tax=Corynebacterium gerontici TaxID=2079234 RepID=A0A3G6IXQ0_9CORY|nr:MFS transporter [Corynebacterium gerontici]AZA10551.1 Major Facilitator Superfamily protein [Corynebacterium gerontici]
MMKTFLKPLTAWLLITPLTRLVVTTIPMVAVVGTSAVGKSYVAGGLISGGYAAGEAIGAVLLTHRLNGAAIKRQCALICAISAALLGLAGFTLWSAPDWWPLAGIAVLLLGMVSSPLPGVLRSSATQLSEKPARILSIDNVINQACWVIGPVIGVMLVHKLNTFAAYLCLAALMLASVVLVFAAIPKNYKHQSGTSGKAKFRPIAVPVVASGVIMAVTAAFDTLVPGLLQEWFGSDERTSFVLAVLAIGSVLTSAVFGLKQRWSRPESIAMASTVMMILLLGVVGSAPNYVLLLVLAGFIGVVQAPSMVLRQVIVSDVVPDQRKAAAFSMLYAAGGVGYAASAAVTPWMASMLSAQFASVITAVLCLGVLAVAVKIQRSGN